MKTTTLCLFTCLLLTIASQAQDNRIAYSYLSATVEKAIPETMDKDELTAKEEKLYEKFMKRINNKSMLYFENNLSEKLTEKGFAVLPLNAVSVMGKSAMNLEGYPFIFFPKRTLKKHAEKNVAEHFISATLSISKPVTAVIGMKPTIIVSLKIFDKNGVLIDKVSATQKTEKKISNIGFAVNEKESFSKIDIEHAAILFSKMEETIGMAINEAINKLK